MATLRDFWELQKLLPPPQWFSSSGEAVWIVAKGEEQRPTHLYTCIDLSAKYCPRPLLDEEHELCTMTEDGKFKPLSQAFVPFDKKRAPLNDNLLVYINGQILWDNVRLAQQSKEL